jgi:hypothetical protein
MMLLWPLFSRWAWFETTYVLEGTKFDGVVVASFRFVGVGSASHCRGGHEN